MMKKLNELLNKPITWKDSLIATAISLIIALIEFAFLFGWFKILGKKIEELFKNVKSKIKK